MVTTMRKLIIIRKLKVVLLLVGTKRKYGLIQIKLSEPVKLEVTFKLEVNLRKLLSWRQT